MLIDPSLSRSTYLTTYLPCLPAWHGISSQPFSLSPLRNDLSPPTYLNSCLHPVPAPEQDNQYLDSGGVVEDSDLFCLWLLSIHLSSEYPLRFALDLVLARKTSCLSLLCALLCFLYMYYRDLIDKVSPMKKYHIYLQKMDSNRLILLLNRRGYIVTSLDFMRLQVASGQGDT